MSAALSCTGRYAKGKEAGGLRGQWAKGEGPSGSTMQMLSCDISDLSLKFLFCFFCFFLSGQSVTIKLLLIRIIRGCRLFFQGGIFVAGKKKTQKHPNSCIGCFCLSDVGSRVPPELNLESITSTVGNRWNLKRRWLNWWGDYSFRCCSAVIWEEEAASRITSGWRRQTERPPALRQSSQLGAEETSVDFRETRGRMKRNAAQLRHRVHTAPPCWTF